jgi:hypothetical protein
MHPKRGHIYVGGFKHNVVEEIMACIVLYRTIIKMSGATENAGGYSVRREVLTGVQNTVTPVPSKPKHVTSNQRLKQWISVDHVLEE